MLGELNVSQVSHGPCMHLSPFAIKQRRTDSSDIPLFGTVVCRRVLDLPPHGEVVPDFTLGCRLLSLGIAAVIEFCLAASD